MMKENDPSVGPLPEQLVTVILLGSARRAHDCRETEKKEMTQFTQRCNMIFNAPCKTEEWSRWEGGWILPCKISGVFQKMKNKISKS